MNDCYTIPCGNGYSCLGFDVCQSCGKRLAAELGKPWNYERGSQAAIDALHAMQNEVLTMNKANGYRAKCELHPRLIGYEGERVEITRKDGTKERFHLGKSTGWIPCHLALHNRRSTGGDAISADADIVSVKTV